MYSCCKLSQDEALRIVLAVREKLTAENKDAAVAVVDEHGELMAFLRSDNCNFASINIAINKAFTAARDQKRTATLAEECKLNGYNTTYFGDLRYTGFGGGIPIAYEGRIVGGIGVSGLSQEEDEAIARFALGQL